MIRKLIRDLVPELSQIKGDELVTEVLDEVSFKDALKVKLVEEAEEVKVATSDGELLEELADVLQIVLSLAEAYGIDQAQLEQKRQEKEEKAGAFKQRLLLVGKNEKVD